MHRRRVIHLLPRRGRHRLRPRPFLSWLAGRHAARGRSPGLVGGRRASAAARQDPAGDLRGHRQRRCLDVSLHRRRGPTTQQLDDRRRHSFGCQPRRPGYPRRVAGEQLHEVALVIHRREGHPRRQQHPPEEHDGLALRPGGARRVWEQRPAAAPKARHLEPGNVSHGRVRRAHGPGPDAASAAKLPRRELPPATLRRLVQGDPEEDPCLAGLDVLRAGRRKLNLSEHEPHRQEEGIRRVGHQERVPRLSGGRRRGVQQRLQPHRREDGLKLGARQAPDDRLGITPEGPTEERVH